MITQAQLIEMNSGVAQVHRMRGEYLKARATVDRRWIMQKLVKLEHELLVQYGLQLDPWDLQEAPPSVA